MKTPQMQIPVEQILSALFQNKLQEIINFIKLKQKIENFKAANITSKEVKRTKKIAIIKIYYNNDLWIRAEQNHGINGIEKVSFVSKYVNE